MGLFDNYDNLSKNYIPNNLRDVDINKYTTTSPYEEYDINGNHIGYFWYYGDTVNLQFNIDGLITVDNNSIIYNVSGDAPNESVPGEINQKAYNIIDLKSWTLISIENDSVYNWVLDSQFIYPVDGIKKVYFSAEDYLQGKQLRVRLYDFRYEVIYEEIFDGNITVNLNINNELSQKLVKGNYYCTITAIDAAQCINLPIIKDKECLLVVK